MEIDKSGPSHFAADPPGSPAVEPDAAAVTSSVATSISAAERHSLPSCPGFGQSSATSSCGGRQARSEPPPSSPPASSVRKPRRRASPKHSRSRSTGVAPAAPAAVARERGRDEAEGAPGGEAARGSWGSPSRAPPARSPGRPCDRRPPIQKSLAWFAARDPGFTRRPYAERGTREGAEGEAGSAPSPSVPPLSWRCRSSSSSATIMAPWALRSSAFRSSKLPSSCFSR
mmetsp:Transcript_159081/g.510180  ORF Transcript_159081/g.510180 Transcript_159081/m.510180 type:complete len:229 (+) Transcript_159081:1366-2052(+)